MAIVRHGIDRGHNSGITRFRKLEALLQPDTVFMIRLYDLYRIAYPIGQIMCLEHVTFEASLTSKLFANG